MVLSPPSSNVSRHWFALDIDGYAESSGNIVTDGRLVLDGLGWGDVETFVVASASYGIKAWHSTQDVLLGEQKN